MTAPRPCHSDLVLGLSSDEEDDEEYATPDDSSGTSSGGDVGAEGLSSTPSTSSESGSSSLEVRRSPPRPRVAKRSLRGDLLERWPGWTSPARKRLRSASPDAATASASAWWPTPASHPPSPALSSAGLSAGVLVREYDRFWKLVEKIASSSPSLVRTDGPDDDRERLCCGGTASSPASTSRSRPWSPRPGRLSLAASRGSSRSSPTLDSSSGDDVPPPWVSQDPGLQSVILAVPDEVLEDEFDILPPPSPFSGEPTRTPREVADGRVGTPRPPPGPRPPDKRPPDIVLDVSVNTSSQRDRRDGLLERLQMLSGRAEEVDKLEVEEDSSVLQLLVLTPTDERKVVGSASAGALGPAAGPGRPPRKTTPASLCRRALGFLVRLKFPYFLVILGIIQVTLFAAPTPYGSQELKNMFVWDSSHMFREPWRTVSYAMLHSGQMHVALNVGVQTFVGTSLEREQGACRVAGVYFGGALYGALVTGVAHPALLMVGASAGIYSLLMSHLAQIWMNMDTVRYGKTRAGAVLLLTSADMVYTAHHAIKRGNAAPRIGVTAHCAGAVSGLFLGLVLYHTVPAGPGRADGGGGGRRTCCCFYMRSVYRAASIVSAIVLAATAVFCLVWVHLAQMAAAAET